GERPAALAAAAPSGASSADSPDARIRELERRMGELELQLDSLQRELASARSPRVPADDAPATPVAGANPPSGNDHSPAWYLDQSVASFAGGGEGSEYFRLAVEAFAPSLLREIGALVLDRRANVTLRLRLVEMLGSPRLRGDGTAIGLCLRLVPGRDDK